MPAPPAALPPSVLTVWLALRFGFGFGFGFRFGLRFGLRLGSNPNPNHLGQ